MSVEGDLKLKERISKLETLSELARKKGQNPYKTQAAKQILVAQKIKISKKGCAL